MRLGFELKQNSSFALELEHKHCDKA